MEEEAIRGRVFHQTMQDIKARNVDADPEEIQRIVNEAVAEVRADAALNRRSNQS